MVATAGRVRIGGTEVPSGAVEGSAGRLAMGGHPDGRAAIGETRIRTGQAESSVDRGAEVPSSVAPPVIQYDAAKKLFLFDEVRAIRTESRHYIRRIRIGLAVLIPHPISSQAQTQIGREVKRRLPIDIERTAHA